MMHTYSHSKNRLMSHTLSNTVYIVDIEYRIVGYGLSLNGG